MPSRDDPFGDYDHVRPKAVDDAVKDYQLAKLKWTMTRHAMKEAAGHAAQLKKKHELAAKEVEEAQHCLLLSAEHAFIPPMPMPEEQHARLTTAREAAAASEVQA